MAAKGIMETFYVSFLGPIVYNSVAMSLRATGEELIEEITARQMMEGRKLKIVEYIDLFLRPFRSIGIPVPDFKEGFMGIVDHSFGIASSAGFFELGPYEAYTKAENGHPAAHLFKYGGQR